MILEAVSNIEITDDGLLMLKLEGGGKPFCQHVYRAAAGVYWDQDRNAFKFATKKDGSYAQWFAHMRKVIEGEMGLQLCLSKDVTWTNVPDDVRNELLPCT